MNPGDDFDNTELFFRIPDVIPFKITAWNNLMHMNPDRLKEYRAAKEVRRRKRPRAVEDLIPYENEEYRLEKAKNDRI